VEQSVQNGLGRENFRNYLVLVFDKPFETASVWSDDEFREGVPELTSHHAGVIIGHATTRGE